MKENSTSKAGIAIDVKNLTFKYGTSTVLENITFQVHKGEYLGIIGPNGGGKTTLLKIMLGLLKPTKGSVKIFGKDPLRNERRSAIGYVPQKFAQQHIHFPASVEEIVMTGRTAGTGMFRRFQKNDYRAAEKALEITGMKKYAKKLVGNLSGGEHQKVFIARALASEPEILILDEPTVAIDIASQANFYSFLEELNRKLGLTIIFVSHDIDVVAKQVNTVLCLNRGLVCHGSPAQFIKDEYLEKLYGKKVKFILHGH